MHGRVLFLLGDLLAGETPSPPVTSSRGGLRNFLGPLAVSDRFTAGGLIGTGESDDELRKLMKKLARRMWHAGNRHALWSQSEPLTESEWCSRIGPRTDRERWENPNLPSGYTYLLQLIAHDMVDSACSVTAEGERLGVANVRRRALALDAIYGSGPDEYPLAYEFDEAHSSDVREMPRLRLRLGPRRTVDGVSTVACPFRDIARGRTDPTEADDAGNDGKHLGRLREALVADPRNDDNFLVSQLTALWHLFHNHVLALLPSPEPSPPLLSKMASAYRHLFCGRLAVTLVYRNIILQDVLPRILHPVVRKHYLHSDFGGRCHTNFRINPEALEDREEGIPLEFSHGAFRFGHAMVRDGYRINAEHEMPLTQAIKDTSFVGRFRDNDFVSDEWLVDWARFFALDRKGPLVPNESQRIGPSYADALRLHFPANDTTGSLDVDGLPNREMLSASYAHIWSVPRLFDKLTALKLGDLALGLETGPLQRTPKRPYDAWRERIRDWLSKSPLPHDPLSDRDIDRIADDPPLPFFILFEAAYAIHDGVPDPWDKPTGGAHLGPVGSIIVAETLCGALVRQPIAFEAPGSTLEARLEGLCSALLGKSNAKALAGLAAIDTMPDLIRFMVDQKAFEPPRRS